MNVWPVYIPSKGRPQARLFNQLWLNEVEHTIVVEPKEVDLYEEQLPESYLLLYALPENNQGLAYSRQHILNLARAQGHQWFWMLDDDITRFHVTIGGKNMPMDARHALLFSQEKAMKLKHTPIAQIGLEYQQFAWASKTDYHFNSYCDVAVAINTERTMGAAYDPQMLLKEDRDFTLQVLHSGQMTCRTALYSFAAPKNGTNSGGLYDEYRAGKEALGSQRMCQKWGPEICQPFTKSDGRQDVRINWKAFKMKFHEVTNVG